jgi:hypothetical protein
MLRPISDRATPIVFEPRSSPSSRPLGGNSAAKISISTILAGMAIRLFLALCEQAAADTLQLGRAAIGDLRHGPRD